MAATIISRLLSTGSRTGHIDQFGPAARARYYPDGVGPALDAVGARQNVRQRSPTEAAGRGFQVERSALLRALERHLGLALVVFGLVASVTMVAAFRPAERFESTAVVSIQPADSSVNTTTISYIIPSIQARLSGGGVGAAVLDDLPRALRNAAWSVSSSVTPGSGVLSITVSSENERVPPIAANAYAEQLTTEQLGTIPVEVVVINAASGSVPTTRRAPVLVSGLGLALLIAVLAALARLAWTESRVRGLGADQPALYPAGAPPERAANPGRSGTPHKDEGSAAANWR